MSDIAGMQKLNNYFIPTKAKSLSSFPHLTDLVESLVFKKSIIISGFPVTNHFINQVLHSCSIGYFLQPWGKTVNDRQSASTHIKSLRCHLY